ncbi:holo-ACP synthase [Lacisediminihabitans changchengi]|uniref:Holo-[acyl-carrier-protein] synthase n=1 Tax=Lacisediminihabitans changchengi TaxID=2787634 RepID=A0A934SMP9_9MICO|nr:holo-ACP synthase [Lacisediminihabitans changchengi]MBK4348358.1 holo-ACP synthase [Lacisediminihabitans changchengi]
MIVGIGIDVVDLARFERAADRTPALLKRLFADSEQLDGDDRRPLRSMAARFAAKEALIKALGDSTGVRWHDMAVVSDGLRNPSFEVYGALADIVAAKGITRIHLSMSHDAGVAMAYVVAEGNG